MIAEVLVAGIGNIFHGDDAFGCETARRLLELNSLDGVTVIDFGIRSIDLTYALADKCDVAILIDALPRQSLPGTLHVLEIDLQDLGKGDCEPSLLNAHALHPLSVLRAVRSMNPRVARIYLVGCEPAELGTEIEGKLGLSPVVEDAVPRAAELVKSLVFRILKADREGRLVAAGKDG